MRPQIACLKGCKATLTTFLLFDLSPLCFSCVSSNIKSKKMHCHNSRIGQNTPHNALQCTMAQAMEIEGLDFNDASLRLIVGLIIVIIVK